MTGAPFEDWQPQAPSEGFANRVTDAVLRDRALRSVAEPRGHARIRRWIVVAAAATFLIAGAAWAWRSRAPNPEPREVVTQPLVREPALRAPIAAPPAPSVPPSAIARAPAPSPVRARAAPSAPSASASPAPHPSVRIPQCSCNEFACDCGPE